MSSYNTIPVGGLTSNLLDHTIEYTTLCQEIFKIPNTYSLEPIKNNRGNYDMIEDQIYQVIIGKNISIILIQHKAILGN